MSSKQWFGIKNGSGGYVFAPTRAAMEQWVDHRNDEFGDTWRSFVLDEQIEIVEPDFSHPHFSEFNTQIESQEGGAK